MAATMNELRVIIQRLDEKLEPEEKVKLLEKILMNIDMDQLKKPDDTITQGISIKNPADEKGIADDAKKLHELMFPFQDATPNELSEMGMPKNFKSTVVIAELYKELAAASTPAAKEAKADKDAKARAAQEEVEKERQARAAAEAATAEKEREAKEQERAAKEAETRAAAEAKAKAAQAAADKEREAKEKAERDAKEQADREAKQQADATERERKEREAKEQADLDASERERQEAESRERRISKMSRLRDDNLSLVKEIIRLSPERDTLLTQKESLVSDIQRTSQLKGHRSDSFEQERADAARALSAKANERAQKTELENSALLQKHSKEINTDDSSMVMSLKEQQMELDKNELRGKVNDLRHEIQELRTSEPEKHERLERTQYKLAERSAKPEEAPEAEKPKSWWDWRPW